jgi:hypothetical protein
VDRVIRKANTFSEADAFDWQTSRVWGFPSGSRLSRTCGGFGSVKIEIGRDWSEFLRLLISHRVRFVLVGGHAVARHGEPRLTDEGEAFARTRKTASEEVRTARSTWTRGPRRLVRCRQAELRDPAPHVSYPSAWMSASARTLNDLLARLAALPANVKGEIIGGELYTQPRPRARHSRVTSALEHFVGGPFDLDGGGPGGWVILVAPGIELPDAPEVAPDLAGWRRDRFTWPEETESIAIVPDRVCAFSYTHIRSHET